MGSGRSSSKRKPSKKKRSKITSEARRRKRSRRTKSKKLRCRDDSVSYSEEDSRSSLSVSTSSEGDHTRARARKRSDVKGSKKRNRRSYSSSVSSEDSYRVKKKRKSKRNGDPAVKKKTKKKKLKRDVSNDSRSGNSSGGSEFERPRGRSRGNKDEGDLSKARSGSSGGSEFERPRGRSRGNKDEGYSAKARSGTKGNKDRSPSCAFDNIYSDTSGYSNKEKLAGETSSRRLRSVITVANQPEEEEKGWDKDGHKEEIVYDHDDYPSSRSNDSNNDYIGKRDLAHHSVKRRVENIIGEEDVDSKASMEERRESGEDRLVQDDRSIPEKNKKEFSAAITSSGVDDLESILRQKALENLKNFKGGFRKTNLNPSTDQTSKNDSDVKESSIPKAEIVQKDSPEEDDSKGVGPTQVAARITRPTLGRDFSHCARNEVNSSERKYSGTESGIARKRVVTRLDRTALSAVPHDRGASKSELGAPTSMQESSETFSTLKQAPTSQASPNSKLPVAESGVNKNASETNQSVVPLSSDNQDVELKSTSEERNSKEQKDEAKDGSQYEQKTMSVMRGGEMVQVSYKVYIPKNARSLGRSRQLRR